MLARSSITSPPVGGARPTLSLLVSLAAATLWCTGCAQSSSAGQAAIGAPSSVPAPEFHVPTPSPGQAYPRPLPTAQFFTITRALEQRCERLAAQRYPGSVVTGDSGTAAYGLVAVTAQHHFTVTPPFLASDATSYEPAVTCRVQTGSTASAAPSSPPPHCSSVVMLPVSLSIYMFASGRTGTIDEGLHGPDDPPAGMCLLPYGSLPTSTSKS